MPAHSKGVALVSNSPKHVSRLKLAPLNFYTVNAGTKVEPCPVLRMSSKDSLGKRAARGREMGERVEGGKKGERGRERESWGGGGGEERTNM